MIILGAGSPTDPGGGTGGGAGGGTDVIAAPRSFRVTLTGVDGSLWDLTAGPVTLLTGADIMSSPPVKHWLTSAPAVDGSRHTGFRTEQRDVVLPVLVAGDDWESWRTRDRAFFQAIAPTDEATLTMTAPDGVARSLGVRFVADGAGGEGVDPMSRAGALYVLEFIAPQPFWRGEKQAPSSSVTTPVPWLPGPAGGRPATEFFFLNQTNQTINNPGDVPAWPRYVIDGPLSSFSVGVGDSFVTSTVARLAGTTVTIDTAPEKLSIRDQDGVRLNGDMDTIAFAPIPPGAQVPVKLEVNGFGAGTNVRVELTPLYRRPV